MCIRDRDFSTGFPIIPYTWVFPFIKSTHMFPFPPEIKRHYQFLQRSFYFCYKLISVTYRRRHYAKQSCVVSAPHIGKYLVAYHYCGSPIASHVFHCLFQSFYARFSCLPVGISAYFFIEYFYSFFIIVRQKAYFKAL